MGKGCLSSLRTLTLLLSPGVRRRSRTVPTASPCPLSPLLLGSQRRGAPQISADGAPSVRALRSNVHGTIHLRNPGGVAAPRAGRRAGVRVERVQVVVGEGSSPRNEDDEDEGKTMATAESAWRRTGRKIARRTS